MGRNTHIAYLCVGMMLIFLRTTSVSAQLTNRYFQEVFSDVIETNDIVFSTNVPQAKPNLFNPIVLFGGPLLDVLEYDTEDVTLRLDFFEPQDDTIANRPLILLCFGGGFVQGERSEISIRLLAEGLAKMGYATASIDYRLGMDLYDQEIGVRAVYRGVQDSRSAVRFFKANASTYRIDTTNIFIGGFSAGGFIALHNLYLDKESERPPGTFAGTQDGFAIPDQGCLDCVGDNLTYNGQARGLFSLAGAVGELAFLENANDAPPLLFHSMDDGTVPYDEGEPFSDISGLIIGADLPTVFGSNKIRERCEALGIPYAFNSYEDRGHSVHYQGNNMLYPDILGPIGAWFYDQYMKPLAPLFFGAREFCEDDVIQTYSIENLDFEYFIWQVQGGEILSADVNSNSITIEWDLSASFYAVEVLPFLENGVQGDALIINPQAKEGGENTWVGSSNGIWNNPNNWSLGRIPISCDDVIISLPNNASLLPNEQYEMKTLEVSENVAFIIPLLTQIIIGSN